MTDFICYLDWFTKKYQANSDSRFWSFKVGLNVFLQKGGGNIVETGTTRLVGDWGGGQSTLLFADVARHYDKHVWTVDIDPACIETCKQITAEYADKITYVVNDSVEFLKYFNQEIDFLYLDSLDCPEYDAPESPNLVAAQNHQLKEFQAAERLLTDRTVVLLDDNGFSNGGKAKQTKIYLEQTNWMCLVDYQQSLWIKK